MVYIIILMKKRFKIYNIILVYLINKWINKGLVNKYKYILCI